MGNEVTREQFALWSFERDRDEEQRGFFPDERTLPNSWEELPRDDKVVYLSEADYYLKLPRGHWPADILTRLQSPKERTTCGSTKSLSV